MDADKYLFKHALRPFSFSVALFVCLTGILSAYLDGYFDVLVSVAILLAGFLLQAGVNLINDYSDLKLLSPHNQFFRQGIQFNFKLGLVAIALAAVIGVWLTCKTGWPIFVLFVVGLVGALGYTLEPINYKRRGLAVFFVFWLMGTFMVLGTYYMLALTLSWQAFFIAIPVSLFVSLLLLSNELRDIDEDISQGMLTLTVRIGDKASIALYKTMLVLIALSTLAVALFTQATFAWLGLLSLPMWKVLLGYLSKPVAERTRLTPMTGLSFAVFGVLYCIGLYCSA